MPQQTTSRFSFRTRLISGPTVNADSPVVLQHAVGLSLGPAVDLSSSLPSPDLDRALCRNSVLPTLTRRRRSYWAEVNPILRRWQHVNDAKCPVCDGLIRVNMYRHLRLSHTTCQCFWRCPVPNCPTWFASELYGKDHLEEVHKFSEGRGYSYCECLRRFGLEWFGRRSFFDQRGTTGQALWMDLALAQKAGQELHMRCACAAVRELVHAYIDYPHPRVDEHNTSSSCCQIRQDVADTSESTGRTSPVDRAEDIPVMSMPPPLTFTSSTSTLPVVQTPVMSLTPNNRSLSFLQTGPGEDVQLHIPQHRGAVSSISIASTDLLLHVEPLPINYYSMIVINIHCM